jgi:hypothetical protein
MIYKTILVSSHYKIFPNIKSALQPPAAPTKDVFAHAVHTNKQQASKVNKNEQWSLVRASSLPLSGNKNSQ